MGWMWKQEFTCEIGKELHATPQSLGVYKNDYTLADGKMQLSAYVSKSQVVGQIRWSMILVLFVILILAGFSVFFINFFAKRNACTNGTYAEKHGTDADWKSRISYYKRIESNELLY